MLPLPSLPSLTEGMHFALKQASMNASKLPLEVIT